MADTIAVDEPEAIEHAFALGWTDGLPVVPPTPTRVDAMLAAADVEPDAVLGAVVERGKVITAEVAASNAVMAGCRPEYFPIVVTAVQAALDAQFNLNTVVTSTGGAGICVLVSGPLAAEVGMNGQHNALGSGNRANATIGRALRLLAGNALGAKPGRMDASSLGHPGKYTLCFAEDPPPAPWQSLAVQHGHDDDATTVTVMATEGPRQVANLLSEDPEELVATMAAAMRVPSNFIVGKGGQGIAVFGWEHALALREAGWDQARVRATLAQQSRVTPDELQVAGVHLEVGGQHVMEPGDDGRLPTVATPDDVVVVTAGGPGAGWSAWLPSWAPTLHSRAVTRRVHVDEPVADCGPDGCEVPWLAEAFAEDN